MSKIRNFIKRFGRAHTNWCVWWVTYIPSFLIYAALLWLLLTSLMTFYEDTLNIQIVIFYLGGIGLCISLASASFSYARASEDLDQKRQVIWAGEHFLYASILLVTALLVNWLVVEAWQLFNNYAWLKKFKFILGIFMPISYLSAGWAVQDIVRGVRVLDKILSEKTYD